MKKQSKGNNTEEKRYRIVGRRLGTRLEGRSLKDILWRQKRPWSIEPMFSYIPMKKKVSV